jgi:DNA-directed RNA polymerase specialized sigma24 family protein
VGAATVAGPVPTVAEIRDGDEHVLADAVDRWYGSSVRLARALGADEATAHRAAHEGWLSVLDRLPVLDAEKPLHVAALRATVEELATKLAAGDPGPAVGPDSFEEEGHRWAGWWRDEKTPKAWERPPSDEALERALASLDPATAAVIVLRDVDGLGADEIAEISDLTPEDQRVLLQQGRHAIVAALAAEPTDAA